jgi:tetratricopeptide (TPR) repeat protein
MGRDDLLHAAEAVLTQAQRVNPLNTDHSANLARLYQSWAELRADDPALRAELLEKSIAEFTTAVTLSPNAALLWDQLGNAYLAQGDRAKAEETYLHALEIDPYYEQTYLLLADLYDNEGREAESVSLLREGIERIGGLRGERATIQLNSFLGVALSQSGDITGAIESMQQMLAIDPSNLTAMRNMALLYRDAGDPVSAVEWIERTLAATPPEGGDISQLRATAIDIYQRAAEANPEQSQWPLGIARLYQQLGDTDAARLNATQALSVASPSEVTVINEFLATLN